MMRVAVVCVSSPWFPTYHATPCGNFFLLPPVLSSQPAGFDLLGHIPFLAVSLILLLESSQPILAPTQESFSGKFRQQRRVWLSFPKSVRNGNSLANAKNQHRSCGQTQPLVLFLGRHDEPPLQLQSPRCHSARPSSESLDPQGTVGLRPGKRQLDSGYATVPDKRDGIPPSTAALVERAGRNDFLYQEP